MEKYLIMHCSPTLASLKSASLFCLPVSDGRELECQLNTWNRILAEKGLCLTVLRRGEDHALLYLFRRSHLEADLHKPGVAEFLTRCGYISGDVDSALARLQKRLAEHSSFPHEIGLFLGYPLGDVIGFIQNEGKNCKCTGCWKVYGDQCEAEKLFARFQKCREVYARLWRQGRTVRQLTVAA